MCNQNEDSIEKRLTRRQYSIKTVNSNSWFMDVKSKLLIYDLSDPVEYLYSSVKKLQWKSMVTKTVLSYWTETIHTWGRILGH